MDPLLLRPVQVAELLGVGRSKVYELIGRGVLPSIRVDQSIRVPLAALQAWVKEQGRTPATGSNLPDAA